MEKTKKLSGRSLSLEKNSAARHRAVRVLLTAVAGFVTALGRILGYPSQINVAAAVLAGDDILAAAAGSVAAYALMGRVTAGMIQLCSILMIAGIRFIMPPDRLSFFGKKNEAAFTALLTGAVLILFSCVMSVAAPTDAFITSLRMINALLCACTVYSAMTVMRNKALSRTVELEGVNGMYVAILYIVAVSVLSSVKLWIFVPGRALGCLCVLLAVRRYRQTGGAVVGALTTCGVMLCAPSLAKNTLLLATSGLICGVFCGFGMAVAVGVFLFVSIVSLVAMGTDPDTLTMFADMLLGSLMFLALPLPAVNRLAKRFSMIRISGMKSPAELVSQTTSSKLSFASGTIGEIRGQLSRVTDAMERKSQSADLCSLVCSGVCERCAFRNKCLDQPQQHMWSLGKLERICMKYNCVSSDDVQKLLPDCRRPEFMSQRFNKSYSTFVAEKASNIRINEMRSFLTEQLSSMEDMLSDLSARVGTVRSIDSALSSQVKRVFEDIGYPNARTCVFADENMCRRVEVYLTAELYADMAKLTAALSAVVGCDLDLPTVTRAEELTRLTFCEAPSFEAQTAVFSASRGDEYSGDTSDIFDLSSSEKYVVLSDGMGTGKRARLDSVFTVSLVTRLIRCGISMTTAHKMINSMLRVKGWEESFATLDLLRLDLCSGSAKMLKSGAAPSYLCRGGEVKVMTSDAFPAGILPGCSPDVAQMRLFDGDVLMLASDGVDEPAARLLGELASKGMSAEELCTAVGEYCTNGGGAPLRDDVTVIVIRVSKKPVSGRS